MAILDDTSEKELPETRTDGSTAPNSVMMTKEGLEKEVASQDGSSVLNEPVDSAPVEYMQGKKLFALMIATIMGVFLVQIDQTIVATAIPKITDEFKGLDKVSWYSSAYFMTFGGFQPSWGKIMKYFPLKSSFLLAIFVFELGSLICAVAQDANTLIVGRAIAGYGGGGIATGGTSIVALVVEPRSRPQYMSYFGAVYSIAAVTGPLLGGAFSDHVSWRWCFYVNLPIGGVAVALIVLFFRPPSHLVPVKATLKEKLLQMDPVGAAFLMGAIVSYILALEYGGSSRPWNSSVVIGLLVGFVVITAAFCGWEAFQGERGMMVPRLLRKRAVWVGLIYQFFFAGAYFISLYYLPIYFQSVDNTSAVESGVRNLAMILAIPFSSVGAGIIMTKTGITTPLMLVGTVLAIISSGLFYSLDIGTDMGKWIGYQIIAGVAFGGAFQIAMVAAQASVKTEDMSSVMALFFLFQTVGGSFCISAAQSGLVNKIIATLAWSAPDVNPHTVIITGATQIRTSFASEQVPGIIIAYMAGLKVAFAVMTAASGVSLLATLCASWERIHGEKPQVAEAMA